jgi:hypothetical protein
VNPDDRYKKRALEYLDNLANLTKKPETRIEQAKTISRRSADIADKRFKIAIVYSGEMFPNFHGCGSVLSKLWFGIP